MRRKALLGIAFILTIALLLGSCNADNDAATLPPDVEKNLVEEATVYAIAENLKFSPSPNTERLSTSADKTTGTPAAKDIESITPLMGDDSLPTSYVVNYKGGGFIILSADRRLEPILAFSDNGSFPVEQATKLGGVSDWLRSAQKTVELLRSNKLQPEPGVEQMWDMQTMSQITGGIPEIEPPTTIKPMDPIEIPCPKPYGVGPLMQTEWGQRQGYNNLCPYMGCNNHNGRALTGCVGIAMAQVIRYHQQPTTYNYSIMPNRFNGVTTVGSDEMARLIRDVGNAVLMEWGCSSSSSNIGLISRALRINFGYPRIVEVESFNLNRVKEEVYNRRPVLLSGGPKEYILGVIPYRGTGHAWVCDGYRVYHFCYGTPDPNTIDGGDYTEYKETYLHMNWGWNGQLNAWYRPGSYFTPDKDSDYRYQVKMLTVNP